MASGNATGDMLTSRRPQRQRGRDRVASLLAAAAALFVEKGYAAATMTEIAARAGASIGSLYLFFPTKAILAQSLLAELADRLSDCVDGARARTAGQPAAAMADALFDALAAFLAAHPVYAALIDLPGEDAWRLTVRARRRAQIATLFAAARPALPPGQAERLATIVPGLMRIAMVAGTVSGAPPREALLDELRTMLRRHLAS